MGTLTKPSAPKKASAWPPLLALAMVACLVAFFVVREKGRSTPAQEQAASATPPGPSMAQPAAAAAVTPPAPAVAEKPDPMKMAGWKTLRWGMSHSEAQSAAGAAGLSVAESTSNKDGEPILVLSKTLVADIPFEPRLRFTPGLTSVTLLCQHDMATISVYEIITKRMAETLGVPPVSKRGVEDPGGSGLVGFKGIHMRDDTWSFPKTTVNVKFMGSVEKPQNVLWISYADPAGIPDIPLR